MNRVTFGCRGIMAGVLLVAMVLLFLIIPAYYEEGAGGPNWAEAFSCCVILRDYMKEYAKSHEGRYPVLVDATFADLANIGVSPSEFPMKWFRATDVQIASTPERFTITVTARAVTGWPRSQDGWSIAMDQDGNLSGAPCALRKLHGGHSTDLRTVWCVVVAALTVFLVVLVWRGVRKCKQDG